MIKTETIKFYHLDYISKDFIFKNKDVKEFDKSGNCIKIYEHRFVDTVPDIRPIETTLKYDDNNNLVNKISWTPFAYFSEEEYENKYDKNRNLIGYNMKYTSGSIGNVSDEFTPTKGTFKYDEENRLIKSEIVSHNNNNKYGTEESINITYDDSGEIIKKDKLEIINSENQYRHTESKHRFYYNDQGQRLTEIKSYVKYKIDDELLFDSKVIISKDEKLIYDKNDKINKKTKFFYDDEGRIIKQEESFGHDLNDIRTLYLYEYEIY